MVKACQLVSGLGLLETYEQAKTKSWATKSVNKLCMYPFCSFRCLSSFLRAFTFDNLPEQLQHIPHIPDHGYLFLSQHITFQGLLDISLIITRENHLLDAEATRTFHLYKQSWGKEEVGLRRMSSLCKRPLFGPPKKLNCVVPKTTITHPLPL